DYSQRFRHLFGIQNEQALELFYQTVSMKSVGNLTDFVRHHMLGKGTVTARIDELRQNFDNLNLAHLAIMKAKDQITRLLPLVKECDNYRTVNQDLKQLRNCRDHLSGYYAHHHVELLLQRITVLEQELSKIDQRLIKVKEELFQLKRQQTELERDIDDSGGRRLQQIEDIIGSLAVERDKKRGCNSSFQQQLKELDRPPVLSEDDFYTNITDLESLLKILEGDIAELKNSFITASVDLQAIKGQVEQLEAELESLRSRRSNIPLRNLQLRQAMLDVLGVDAAQLPFVGELLQVDEGEAAWEGAIERVLHNFGLSLLVPESLYEQVNVYVERTRLKGRIVYYKVNDQPQKRSEEPATDALCRKVKIRGDSPFYSWLESALVERFNYICCEQLETFRRQPKAITLNGQIKAAGQRHEKDDRRSLQDRSRYILGWSNEEKISVLEQQKKGLEHQGQQLAEQINTLHQQEDEYTSKRDTVRDLQLFTTYDEIAWEPVAQRIQELAEEKEQIEKSSDRLKELRYQLTLAEEKLEAEKIVFRTGGA
ncbi:MAG: ATP-dependent exonuclease SbcCD, C subunit-like protein, partial [Deltaproteobacteria bacterium]|nr:ATP-dependent exonuclease SbcCD, C subunit-like protein [Deltaproteobacteria bacterium]